MRKISEHFLKVRTIININILKKLWETQTFNISKDYIDVCDRRLARTTKEYQFSSISNSKKKVGIVASSTELQSMAQLGRMQKGNTPFRKLPHLFRNYPNLQRRRNVRLISFVLKKAINHEINH